MTNFKTFLVFASFLLLFIANRQVVGDDEMCNACHDDPEMTRVESGIPSSLYVNSGMIEQSVHDGLSCTDCHGDLDGVEEFPHSENLQGVNCADCHLDAFEVYMSGFRNHLMKKGFTNVPGCTQCHGEHEISQLADTRSVCGICHNQQRRDFEKSVHHKIGPDNTAKMSCTSCHAAHDKSQRGEMLPENWRKVMVETCLKCHQKQSQDYLNSVHFSEVKSGNPVAPICTECHSEHDILAIDDPASPVHLDKLDATCDRCHAGHNATIHRKGNVDARLMTCVACHTGHQTQMDRVESTIFKETLPLTCNRCHGDDRHKKENLAHGNIMVMDENGGTANCTKCHIYHWNLPKEDERKLAQKRLMCTNCHVKENRDYEKSAHAIAYRKGHSEAPTCITCHGDREIERISSKFSGQTVISLCSSCHGNSEITMQFQLSEKVVSGYLNTYHGKMYSLGYQGTEFATCVSCHDNHLILAHENPQSSISKDHIIETCGRCHEDANENFVSMLQHYDPMAKAENKILSGIHTFMLWLLGVTLSIFGVHTILWFARSILDRVKHGRYHRPIPSSGNVRYRRFGLYNRILHGMVIISFLTLAMTGLPLKYSHTEISQWMASNLLDLRTMALLHRFAAIVTFTYFALHFANLISKVIRKQSTLLGLLWGPDSLVPQPKDVVDFFKHLGYFLGFNERPKFDRWAYWEKFDYFAVFWGVAIIGISGLTLWFPTIFTRLLPGWAINAAHIIHSEEALLATGFIFTVHFFNVHLRPETFPFDEVIFTGRLSEYLFLHERPLWHERLEKDGILEQYKVAPLSTWIRVLLYGFGFLALAIGLALLTLIVIGNFFS